MKKKYRTDPKGRILHKGETYSESKGLYRYTYTDVFGKRKSIYSVDIVKLREKEKELFRDIIDGIDVYVAGTATVNYVFDRYISTKSDLKSTTVWNYIYTYNNYVREGFGKKKISQVKYSDVIMFYNSLLDRELSVSTVDNVHSVLHPTFELAIRDDIIRKNPTDSALAEIKKRNKNLLKQRHALTIEQQRAFLECLNKKENLRWKPLFVSMFGTGCRVGEIIGLRWDDIDFDKKIIKINHNISYTPQVDNKNRCEYILSLPKTNAGIRNIPLLKEVEEVLLNEMLYQKQSGEKCEFEIDGMSNFVFFNRFHSIHNQSTINKVIKRIVNEYNSAEEVKAAREGRKPVIIPNFSCHVIRHTFCTRLCENETNIKVIQAVMGHKDIQTTMNIYADVSNDKISDVFAGFNPGDII